MNRGAAEQAPTEARRDPNVLISVVASTATALIVLTGAAGFHHVEARPSAFAAFFLLTAALQLVTVEVYNRGAHSFTVLPNDGSGGFNDPLAALTTSTSESPARTDSW